MSDNSGQFSNNTRPRRKVEDQNRPNRQLTSKKEEENEMAKYLIGNPQEEREEVLRERSRDKPVKVKKAKQQSKAENIIRKDDSDMVLPPKEEQDEPMLDQDEKGPAKEETQVKYPGDINAEEYFLARQIGAKLEKQQEQEEELTSQQKKILKKYKRQEAIRILTKLGMSSNKMATTYKLGQDYLKYLLEKDTTVSDMREAMRQAYAQDVKLIENKQMAFHRLRLLPEIAKVLQVHVCRQYFIMGGGFEELVEWLMPIPHPTQVQVEPCLAIKMAVLRILKDLNLTAEEITERAAKAHSLIDKSKKKSEIFELREICSQILKDWDFTMFRQLQHKTVHPSENRSATPDDSLI